MDRLTTCIYKCLWQLLHYFLSLYEFCLWLRLRIVAFLQWSYDLCRTPAQREQNEYDFLMQCRKYLTKIPTHLNIIIGPEDTQTNEQLLTRIFSYALHMNINCISYFDARYIKPINSSKSRVIVLEKLNCPKGWKRKSIDAHHFIWYICKDDSSNGTLHKINGVNETKSTLTNGHFPSSPTSSRLENSRVEIYEIQPKNNRPLIAQVCRDLFKQRHTTEIQNLLEKRTLLTERLSRELSHQLGNLTEPELSIVFSEDICTFGMLPWHTRFTEFHQHASGQYFNAKTFASILHKYSRCEQRWGK